jgi:hypothetical protein
VVTATAALIELAVLAIAQAVSSATFFERFNAYWLFSCIGVTLVILLVLHCRFPMPRNHHADDADPTEKAIHTRVNNGVVAAHLCVLLPAIVTGLSVTQFGIAVHWFGPTILLPMLPWALTWSRRF